MHKIQIVVSAEKHRILLTCFLLLIPYLGVTVGFPCLHYIRIVSYTLYIYPHLVYIFISYALTYTHTHLHSKHNAQRVTIIDPLLDQLQCSCKLNSRNNSKGWKHYNQSFNEPMATKKSGHCKHLDVGCNQGLT